MVRRHCTTKKIKGVICFSNGVTVVLRPCDDIGEENTKIMVVRDGIYRSAIDGIAVAAGMK